MAGRPQNWRARGGFPSQLLLSPDGRFTTRQSAMNTADRYWRHCPITLENTATGELWVRRRGSWFKERAARESDDA